jgi:hypothetical protein
MQIQIEVKDENEAAALRAALADPIFGYVVRIMGAFLRDDLTPPRIASVLDYMAELTDEIEELQQSNPSLSYSEAKKMVLDRHKEPPKLN